MMGLQTKLQPHTLIVLETQQKGIKSKMISKIASVKTWGAIIWSRARFHELCLLIKDWLKLKKHTTSLEINDGDKIANAVDILEEEEIYSSWNLIPNYPVIDEFFENRKRIIRGSNS